VIKEGGLIKVAKEKYLRLNSKYLTEADEFTAKGDYPQASEKLWSAFVDAVKALATSRGVSLDTHRSIAEFISKLDKDYPKWKLREVFRHTESLHVNFSEDHLPEDYVLGSKKIIEDTIKKMLKNELR